MNATVYIVSIIGLVSSIFTTTINCLLIRKTIKKGSKINHEFTLFFYRFILDVMLGSLLGIYLGLVVLYLVFPGNLETIRSHVGLLGLPSSNAAAARAIVAMLISVERNLATYIPIFYHKLRRDLLYVSIFVFALGFGLFEDVVLFLLCDNSNYSLPPTCVAFGCATNSCFKNYWTIWKMINRLALIDATTVLVFDFLPSFCANLWPTALIFSFEYVGPYNAVCKLFGTAVDAVLAYQIMIRSSSTTPKDHSSSGKPNRIKTANTVDCIL